MGQITKMIHSAITITYPSVNDMSVSSVLKCRMGVKPYRLPIFHILLFRKPTTCIFKILSLDLIAEKYNTSGKGSPQYVCIAGSLVRELSHPWLQGWIPNSDPDMDQLGKV